MMILVTILSVIIAIFVFGAIWGKIEKNQNRKRASSVIIPSSPLNNLKVSSGFAEIILGSQFANDVSWYKTHFNAFVFAYTKDERDFDKAILAEVEKYSINTNNKNASPNSIATLVHADELKGEAGAIVQNAITYAIAMSIASESKDKEVKENIVFASSLPSANKNKQTPDELRNTVIAEHPRASAIAETLGNLESKKTASSVVAMMGFLIGLADTGVSETEDEKVKRIFDEQKLGF